LSAIRKSAISEVVYEHITQMLFDGIYPPGTPITRRELAEKMSVSPTPVGEAIARLVGEGIIEQIGRSGYRVKEFTYENMESLYQVRAGMEGMAIRLCLEYAGDKVLEEISSCFNKFFGIPQEDIVLSEYMKADQKFHRRIVGACSNPYILSYNKNHEFQLRSYQKGLLRPPEDTIDEHRSIIEAIRNKDAATAQARMIEHHMATSRTIREAYLV
jgi:DNA-binding GntR family transcriptional regulator